MINATREQHKDRKQRIVHEVADLWFHTMILLSNESISSLEILKELGIELAFKDSMKIEREKGMKKINNTPLEIAREDHAEIIKRMN